MTQAEAKKLIQASELGDSVKEHLIQRLDTTGLTAEVVDEIKSAFQGALDGEFAKLDPEDANLAQYESAKSEMVEEVQNATSEYLNVIHQVEKQLDEVKVTASKDLNDAQVNKLKQSAE